MAKFLTMAAIALLMTQPVAAADVPASAASVQELISLMQGQKLLDGMFSQMDALMGASMKQAMGERQLNAEQQKIVADMQTKMVTLVKESLNWESFGPMMTDIYQKSFSQSEVDGMVKFYKSKAGQAVIAKMPVVMQNTMQAMQGRMQELMPKVRQLAQETAEQLKASGNQDADTGAAASH